MAKEFFTLEASKELVAMFDDVARKTGHGRGRVFTDFLTVSRCALAAQTMEEEYLDTIAKGYTNGKLGSRGIDILTKAFGTLINAMESRDDVLGDIFQGAITYGENGQFFTPDSVCDLMGSLTVPTERTAEPKSVCDPACGSGRQLLSVAKHQPHWEFTGQDLDHRCVQMTAINLGLNDLRGWAVWQNTLTLEVHRVYQIGMFMGNGAAGVIREVPIEQSPFDYKTAAKSEKSIRTSLPDRDAAEATSDNEQPEPQPPQKTGEASQLDLF